MEWHIALSQPNQEKTAFAHLRRLRYEAEYPVIPRKRRLYGKETVYFRPMFPRYLFVKLGANQDWYRLQNAQGVQNGGGLLSFAGVFATISQDEITTIRETAKALNEQIHTKEPEHQFAIGRTVKIPVGPLAEIIFTIIDLDDDARTMGLETYLFGSRREISRVSFDAVAAA